MDAHEPAPANYEAVALREYRAAIEANLSEDDNLASVKAAFLKRMNALYDDKTFVITAEQQKKLLTDAAWSQLDDAAGSRTNRILLDLFHGVLPLPGVDDTLAAPLKVGKHRRSLLKHLATSDITRMIEARTENLARAQKSFVEFEEAAKWLRDLIKKHGSVSAAIKAESEKFGVAS